MLRLFQEFLRKIWYNEKYRASPVCSIILAENEGENREFF
ncbi:hypothetical protein HMPREF9178_0647 [Streptococcus mitis bv. 2 str. F0392]|uniref:Uncharacterized protein n=2 Tax=Streptococcus oralis TaxID=1303 RepID=F9NZW8_STROR|nr:hypothetical protein HMPREF9178_0647 [Streptococcus mitis bv. 2 str. F0392]KXT60427.1 hypothetical protein SORDD05_00796 [Streptococcus oralis]